MQRPIKSLASFGRIRSGLTLLEVLLVLAILTTMAALSLPLMDSIFESRRLNRGAEVVRSQMLQARLEAMRSGRTHIMRCPPGTNEMKVFALHTMNDLTEAADQLGSGTALLQGGTPVAGPQPPPTNFDDAAEAIELPEGVQFAGTQVETTARGMMVANQSQQLPSAGDASPSILFYPDGTTSNAAITVQLNKQEASGTSTLGPRIVVVLRGLTGDATVGEELP